MLAICVRPGVVAAIVLIAGCSTAPGERPVSVSGAAGETVHVFAAGQTIQDAWTHMRLNGETEYRIGTIDGRIGIRATGRDSASGLVRRLEVDPLACPVLEWTWRVDVLQPGADLTTRDGDDVGAALFLLFGDPGFLSAPDPVPTLRYVWTTDRHPVGWTGDNPYLPGVVRNLVVRSGEARTGEWVTERRNIVEDFTLAFGEPPTGGLQAFALFADNDQTGEPVEAWFGEAVLLCGGGSAETTG